MNGSASVGLGTQVQITSGPNSGIVGWVFWEGKSKADTERKRFGVKTGEGEAFWADETSLEVMGPAPKCAAIARGKRVRVIGGEGRDQLGEIFWAGVSRQRPPMPRYGVRTDHGESMFVDGVDVEEL